MPPAHRSICDKCSTIIPPHEHYIVKIEVLADPQVPAIDRNDLDEIDCERRIRELIEQMKHASAEALEDDVHRRFEFRLCRACQRRYLANPLSPG